MNLAVRLAKNYMEKEDKICLVQGDRKVTYKELYENVARFENYLKTKGIEKGDRVLVLVPMSIELYVTLLASWSLGAIPVFMDAGFIRSHVKKNDFEDIKCVVGISKYILYSNINSNLRKLKLKINVNVINKLEGDFGVEIAELEEDYPAIVTYTSGSTGKPKIAERSHEFLDCQGRILETCLNYENKDIELSSVPIFTLSNINVGITTVISDGNYENLGESKADKLIAQIQNEKVNRIMASPGLLNVITKYCTMKGIVLTQVDKVFTGGGAVFLDFVDELRLVFPKAKIVTLYGSTEAEPIAELDLDTMSEEEIERTQNGYGIFAGKIIGVKDCRIIKTGQEEIGDIFESQFKKLETESVGEIVVAGDNVLKGYVGGFGDRENKFSVDGVKYHRTGDLGFIDGSGKLWLRGREKSPFFNIEAALHSRFKGIGKTAVIRDVERIILVLENGSRVSEKQILDSISFEKISKIRFVKKIPVDKRHSTKVDYNALKKMLKIK